ncbi:MAG TPA: large-conductance mechanosensitive channel protein MscL [Blastocatellia bacterium]|nr:large-conductance mechanosensitive channel protein MscL [Blastocatellia bacterium]
MGMVSEFKDFINKGNVVDLAVGVVIGGAFGKIVSSFVDDMLMPVIGNLMGGASFKDLKHVFTPAVLDAAGKVVTPENAFRYGSFIQTIIDFIIIAFAVFLVVKAVNRMRKEEAAAGPTPTEVLLTEIRDLLRR